MLFVVTGIEVLCLTLSFRLHAADVQVGQYSTLLAMLTVTQADLLAAIITI